MGRESLWAGKGIRRLSNGDWTVNNDLCKVTLAGFLAGAATAAIFSLPGLAAGQSWQAGQLVGSYDLQCGVWGIASAAGTERLDGNVIVVRFRDRQVRADEPCRRQWSQESGRDQLGNYLRFQVTHSGLPLLDELVWSLVVRQSDGQPWVFIKRWSWAPYGSVFNLDPTHPMAQEHYRQSLGGLMDAGCRYYKVDFIGSAGAPNAVFHDPLRARGNPMARYEMQQIRNAIGPNSWLRYCSAPANVYCGIVNIGGATADIGNPAGNWEWLAKYHQQLGSCWYKHRRFWHNEPDALIVGEGKENEARMRCAWLVMSGGVVALGDNLTKIAADRMEMISKCLPPYDVAARPLDLFEEIPSRTWDLTVKANGYEYHVVTLFNLQSNEQTLAIPLERIGLDKAHCAAWEFWTQSLVPAAGGAVRVVVPAHDCRIVAVHQETDHPQVLATDMHLTMGGVELPVTRWDGPGRELPESHDALPVPRGTSSCGFRPDGRLSAAPLRQAMAWPACRSSSPRATQPGASALLRPNDKRCADALFNGNRGAFSLDLVPVMPEPPALAPNANAAFATLTANPDTELAQLGIAIGTPFLCRARAAKTLKAPVLLPLRVKGSQEDETPCDCFQERLIHKGTPM